jgi:UDP-N-acetylglucosamine 2-epimerase (non-hydrolysing)
MRVLSVFGTRPEAIKMAPVVHALAQQKEVLSRVCVTGQHRQMLDQVMATFALKADYDLNIMQPGQALGDAFARVLSGLGPILAQFQPDYVLVQGDTVSSTAAAVAAFYSGVAVGHVEAGLRTGDLKSPWPEEANRAAYSRCGVSPLCADVPCARRLAGRRPSPGKHHSNRQYRHRRLVAGCKRGHVAGRFEAAS